MFIIMQMSKKTMYIYVNLLLNFTSWRYTYFIKVSDLIKYIYELNMKRSDLN